MERGVHYWAGVYKSPEMADMMAAAERGEFEVLLVGYVSRWQRNLRRTLELLEDTLHPAGVAVYFADEEILSSNDRHWDQLVDEAKDAERFSRKHSRRVHEGYASKLLRHNRRSARWLTIEREHQNEYVSERHIPPGSERGSELAQECIARLVGDVVEFPGLEGRAHRTERLTESLSRSACYGCRRRSPSRKCELCANLKTAAQPLPVAQLSERRYGR